MNVDPSSQKENDEVKVELSATVSDLVEYNGNPTDDATIFDDLSSLPTYTVLLLMPDNVLTAKIRPIKEKKQ